MFIYVYTISGRPTFCHRSRIFVVTDIAYRKNKVKVMWFQGWKCRLICIYTELNWTPNADTRQAKRPYISSYNIQNDRKFIVGGTTSIAEKLFYRHL
jgi:hypothetical protein